MINIHLAAYFGLQESMSALLDKNANVESKPDTTLMNCWERPRGGMWAVGKGHEAVVNLLLDK